MLIREKMECMLFLSDVCGTDSQMSLKCLPKPSKSRRRGGLFRKSAQYRAVSCENELNI